MNAIPSWRTMFPDCESLDIQSLRVLAEQEWLAGDYQSAVLYCVVWANADVDDIAPLLLLARCLQRLGEDRRALAVCRDAAVIDMFDARPPLIACGSFISLGQLGAATRALDAARFIAGGSPASDIRAEITLLGAAIGIPPHDPHDSTVASSMYVPSSADADRREKS